MGQGFFVVLQVDVGVDVAGALPELGVEPAGGVEDGLVDARELRGHVQALCERDLGEERVVAQASAAVVAGEVERVRVGRQVQVGAEPELGVFAPSPVGTQALVDVGEHAFDAVLFLLEDGQADRVGVAGLQQPELLVFEALLLPGQIAALGLGFDVDAVEAGRIDEREPRRSATSAELSALAEGAAASPLSSVGSNDRSARRR